MPWRNYTQQREGKTFYCMETIATGKKYCYKSKADREEGKRMHKMFKHMKTNKK
jgi:hypothetical protein